MAEPAVAPALPDFTPVHLITGFLGAGKTTLLKRLLAQPALSDAAVLINEFGEVGLDHHLLERIDEQTVLLPSGCVCCTVRGELVDALLSLLSLALVFVVLYSRYRSAALALIVMGNVPLALIGSVTALWWSGQPLSVASMIGFITLTGIAARNGILKISHYINLAIHEGMPFGRELVMRGSLERLTPVLMTAVSAGVALVPLMIDAQAPGKEILHPVAITIFGGLVSATLLDTFLTPVLFLRYGEKPLRRLLDSVRAEAVGKTSSPESTSRPIETF